MRASTFTNALRAVHAFGRIPATAASSVPLGLSRAHHAKREGRRMSLGPRPVLSSAIVALSWVLLVFLAARFVFRFVLPYSTFREDAFGRFWSHRWWLIPHITGGTTALLLGPFQFWPGLRRRALGLHRWTGRLYLLAILVTASTALYLSFFIPATDGGWMGGGSLMTLALFWLASGTMAYVAIHNGRVQSHKEWMIRSYVLTFFFVNVRWWVELPVISTMGTPMERTVIAGWLAWVLPLLVTELALQWKHVRKPTAA
jgi:uncharacterized membrane protein